MKKILSMALLSVTIMANANNENEIQINKPEVVNLKMIAFEIADDVILDEADLTGCGVQGNGVYQIETENGASHRDAIATRRAFVKKCRGYFWQFGF